MNAHSRSALVPWLVGMTLLGHAALGQTLSFVRKGGSEFVTEVATPADGRFVLQSSDNLDLWVDCVDEVRGGASYRFSTVGLPKLFLRLKAWSPPAPPIIVMVIGDSTAADYRNTGVDLVGWGQELQAGFKPNAQVVNLAWPGTSTTVFLVTELNTKMLRIQPDYVLAQFGRVDVDGRGPELTSLEQYEENLRSIVQSIRGFQGTPILITPLAGRIFDAQGKVVPIYQDRCAVVRKIATELQTGWIDLNQLSVDLYNALGDSGSADLTWPPGDGFHYSRKGARVISGLVVDALPGCLGPYLVGRRKPLPGP